MREMRGLRGYGIKGLRPYYAPNPLRGGAAKGARGGRGEEKFKIRPAVAGSRMCGTREGCRKKSEKRANPFWGTAV